MLKCHLPANLNSANSVATARGGGFARWLATLALAITAASSNPTQVFADQSSLAPNTKVSGPVLKFDWPAIDVGFGSYEEGPTGLTIIRFLNRASVVVDSRGGAPGTVNTDDLRLGYDKPFVDAVVFAGGSSYGEEAITGVQSGLKDEGVRSGAWGNIAFTTGAVIYDLGSRRLNEIYPDKRLAEAALQNMHQGVFPLGAQGAGRMAMQGSFFGCDAHSGEGAAYRQLGPVKIAAFVVVNAAGVLTDRSGHLVSCYKAASWKNLSLTSDLIEHVPGSLENGWSPDAAATDEAGGTKNTTISLIVTNQKLDYATLERLAIQVHTSMARAIQPFSTGEDGDTLFAASTQEVNNPEISQTALSTVAGEVMWDAMLSSVPIQAAFKSPDVRPTLGATELSALAGTYDFAPSPVQAPGPFIGLGLQVKMENGLPIINPTPGSPALKAGVQAGDVVSAIDGRSVQGIGFSQTMARLAGPAGSKVNLTIKRAGQSIPLHLSVVRGEVWLRPLLKISNQSGSLLVDAIGGENVFEFKSGTTIPIIPLSNMQFYVAGRYQTRITFTKDSSGKVVGAVLNPGPWQQVGDKVAG